MRRNERWKGFWIFLAVVLLDGGSKYVVHTFLKPPALAPPHYPFGGISVFHSSAVQFCIHHVTNRGAAWGVASAWRLWIVGTRVAVVVALTLYLLRGKYPKVQREPLLLILAGGVGNVMDHFLYGHVIDLFHFIFWGYSYPVFNVADSAIFLGVVLFAWNSFRISRDTHGLAQS